MPHWELKEKRIYQLLKHPYQNDKNMIEDVTSAYLEFVEDLFDYLNEEKDGKLAIRKLNTTYLDLGALKALEETLPTEDGNLKFVVLDKLLSLINLEQELIYRQMEHPKFFINIETEWKSPFYLNHEVVNSTDIMEIVTGIFYTKDALYRIDRKEIFFSDFAHAVEKLFNIDFGDIYKKERSVIKRTPNKKTDFLDRLKAVIFQKSKDEGYP